MVSPNKVFLLVLLSAFLSLTEGLKCYQCGYIKGIDKVPIPPSTGLSYGEECKSRNMPDNFLSECSPLSINLRSAGFQNASDAGRQSDSDFVCGKFVVSSEGTSIHVRSCLSKSILEADIIGKCQSVELSDFWSSIKEVADSWGIPISDDPPQNVDTSVCYCDDKDGCNGSGTLSVAFTAVLFSILVHYFVELF